jgi:hypothetical protein
MQSIQYILISNWISDTRIPPLMIYIEITINNSIIRGINSLQAPFNGSVIRIFSFSSFVVDVENSELFNAWV